MLDSALEGARSAGAFNRKIKVPDLGIHPCKGCNACFENGRCIQEDDMQDLYPLLLSREGIVLAAPIFSMNLAAQAKIMIDRLQCLWARKEVLGEHTVPEETRGSRRGLWLSAAGMNKPEVFEPAYPTVRYFFGMLEIGKWEKLTYPGVDEKGDIEKAPGALEACRQAGARMVEGGGT